MFLSARKKKRREELRNMNLTRKLNKIKIRKGIAHFLKGVNTQINYTNITNYIWYD